MPHYLAIYAGYDTGQVLLYDDRRIASHMYVPVTNGDIELNTASWMVVLKRRPKLLSLDNRFSGSDSHRRHSSAAHVL